MELIEYQSLVDAAHQGSDWEITGEITEERLLIEIKNIKSRIENSKLLAYHAIGTRIMGFYGKNYGNNEMAKIAKAIDLPISTVYKILQFAEKYDQQDLEEISGGPFQLSWHRLRDNLSLQKEDVLKTYRASHNILEFSRKIKQVKLVSKSEGDMASGKSEISVESNEFCPGELNSQPQESDMNLTELQADITRLQSELEEKKYQIEVLHEKMGHWKTEWLDKFPEMLRDLDKDTLLSLEFSLIEEKRRRETEMAIGG